MFTDGLFRLPFFGTVQLVRFGCNDDVGNGVFAQIGKHPLVVSGESDPAVDKLDNKLYGVKSGVIGKIAVCQ